MALPISRQQFKDFILRQLGAPVLQLEIDDEQVEDNIDMALDFYARYHADGTEKSYLKHEVTQSNVDNQSIELPDNIIGVVSIYPLQNSISSGMLSPRYQVALHEMHNLSGFSMTSYDLSMTRLNMLDEYFGVYPDLEFNVNTRNVRFNNITWGRDIKVGDNLAFLVYAFVGETSYIWKDRWLINYATALVKRQWGLHLSKFNITLIGNVTYNGQEIYQQADQEVQRLENEAINNVGLPVMDMIG